MERVTLMLDPSIANIKKAAAIMKKGGIVIYPTESSYAIGCDFSNANAIKRIYKVKKRPASKRLTTIVANLEMAKKYCKLNELAEKLVKRFMPGPLTLIVDGKRNLKKFRFRISENRTARFLSKALGKPIVATSANISRKPNIYDSKDLEKFFGRVDAIIDAGNLPVRKVSTIVGVGKKPKIIREGAISKERVMKVK